MALTSGKMKEVISAELSRVEAENSAWQAEAEEIRSELLSQGDIQKFWDEKLSEEKNHGLDVERLYLKAVNNLEEEKINQDKMNSEILKEKAAMDCQKQLLLSLKKEVDEISEKLASERVVYVDEKHTVQKLLGDLEFKHEQMLDTKSTLQAEKEALQMLRYPFSLFPFRIFTPLFSVQSGILLATYLIYGFPNYNFKIRRPVKHM